MLGFFLKGSMKFQALLLLGNFAMMMLCDMGDLLFDNRKVVSGPRLRLS